MAIVWLEATQMVYILRTKPLISRDAGIDRGGSLRPALVAKAKRQATLWRVRCASAIALMALGLTMAAPLASAAEGGIYAVTPDWGGWKCPGNYNNLVFVYFANHTLGKNGGDAGDDIVWMPVSLGRDNHVTMSAKCTFGTFLAMNYVIKPKRNKQTFWFRLNGSYKNN